MRPLIFLLSLILCAAIHAHVSVHFRGRLGNQLFQAAAAIALAKEHGCEVYFPDFENLHLTSEDYGLEQLKLNYQRIFSRIPSLKTKISPSYTYIEPDFSYHKIPYQEDTEIIGYFMSERHFQAHEEEIINLLSPSAEIETVLNDRFSDLLQHEKSVGIHVRTGYLEWSLNNFDPSFYDRFLAPDMAFFKEAISYFDADSVFVIFSDHIDWCKEQFSAIDRTFIYVEDQDHILDLYLMSKCKHTIIANSSFGWWAAYLNRNPYKKVICRMPFWICDPSCLTDIVCSNWKPLFMYKKPPIPEFKGAQ